MTSLDAWSSIGCAAMHTSCKTKKNNKKNRSPHWGWLSNYFLWHCNAFLLCVAAANCSLLFLESLVPFLNSPYNRIVNLELIKFAAKLLPMGGQLIVYAFFLLPPQLDYIFVVYCINTSDGGLLKVSSAGLALFLCRYCISEFSDTLPIFAQRVIPIPIDHIFPL